MIAKLTSHRHTVGSDHVATVTEAQAVAHSYLHGGAKLVSPLLALIGLRTGLQLSWTPAAMDALNLRSGEDSAGSPPHRYVTEGPVQAMVAATGVGGSGDWANLLTRFLRQMDVKVSSYEGKWRGGIAEWLQAKGVSPEEVSQINGGLEEANGGRGEGGEWDASSEWRALRDTIEQLLSAAAQGGVPAPEAAEGLRLRWQVIHDRLVGVVAGLLAFVVDRFGEEGLGSCLGRVVSDDAMTGEPREVLERALEALGWGHLSGTGRQGSIPVEEYDNRWVLSLTPCGSGGHVAGASGLTVDPPTAGVLTSRHDWAWGTAGVCHYCAHCCLTLEILPARKTGHPSAVVEPPRRNPDTGRLERATCTFTIYKDPRDIPVEEYGRIGLSPPPGVTPEAPCPPSSAGRTW